MTQAVFTAGNTWSLLKDLNNDGYGDIVLGGWDSNGQPSKVLLNDGHGSFAQSVPIDLPRSGIPLEVVIGISTIDLNGDKLPDLMLSVTNGGARGAYYQVPYLQLLVNDGNGKFHDETQARLPQSLAAKAPGEPDAWYLSATPIDMNGDGFQDIVADGSSGGPGKIFLNDGTGKFSLAWQSPRDTKVVAADIDGDGMPELVLTSATSGLSVLYNVLPRAIGASHEYHASARGDTVKGSAAADKIFSGAGNDNVDGGAGLDTMAFAGKAADYALLRTAAGYSVTDKHGVDGADSLVNVERLQFADVAVAIDIDGTGGQAYRLYQAAFNRAPDAAGLGFQMWAMDEAHQSLAAVAQGFIDSAEFKQAYGSLDNRAFVTQLYANVLHRTPDEAGLAWHVKLLDDGTISRADDLVVFSESAENQAALIGSIQNGMVYVPFH
jgi:hypothetical protein